jgi:hypothetical protein
MIYLSLRRWSGQFQAPWVIRKIRRVILNHVGRDECVLVLDDGASGLTEDVKTKLQHGWPEGKVLWSHIHPVLGGPWKKAPHRRRPTPPV